MVFNSIEEGGGGRVSNNMVLGVRVPQRTQTSGMCRGGGELGARWRGMRGIWTSICLGR